MDYTIIDTEEFTAEDMGCDIEQALAELGGAHGMEGDVGLGAWMYQITIELENGDQYRIDFEPEERSNGMKAYSGYDVCGRFTDDDWRSLCDDVENHDEIYKELQKVAEAAAKERFLELTA